MPDAIRHITLVNGLQLTLRHAPRLKRAAAALRVHAGSHDAPQRWPGLAHFLEHLFFLGSGRFGPEQGLMRFVQALGGQVNASTRERTTDFFFEVPPAALAGGLERLCHMLAAPDLSIERQLREREVIHAEFIAWARNLEAQRHFSLLQAVSPNHPLSGFHAGNRHSLAVHSPAFQTALRAFHTSFYQGGQITLCVCGPQPLDELEALARPSAGVFASGDRATQAMPPPLLDGPLGERADSGLLFAQEHLPPGAEQALELLLAYLGDNRPGGWLARLREQGQLQDYNAEVLYSFSGQLLWHIRLKLGEGASTGEAKALLDGWLNFIRQADVHQLNEQFGQLQQSREGAASALELARRDSTHGGFQALDGQGLNALGALLDSLAQRDLGHWHLPPADPLLTADLPSHTAPLPSGLTVSDCLPSSRHYAALYLRWHIPSPLRNRLHIVLTQALRPLVERAERASVQLDFSLSGEHWQLRCAGLPASVIRTVDLALRQLQTPEASSWQALAPSEPPLIPIRALLKALPDALQARDLQPLPACMIDQSMLDSLWREAQWQGLAVGFGEAEQAALGGALDVGRRACLPALAQPLRRAVPTGLRAQRRWRHALVGAHEHALLLFCPLPGRLQTTGRLLAQLLQGPVYQRLRVDLQLGYAVFSAFRQIDGIGGLLFGVQSPNANPEQILAHLLDLLKAGVTLAPASRQALADGFSEETMPNADVAQWAWQTYLATEPLDLPGQRASILTTSQAQLDALRQAVLSAKHGWLCLATTAAPDDDWQ